MFVLVIYPLCGDFPLHPLVFNEVLLMLLFETESSDPWFYLLDIFAIAPLLYKITFRTNRSFVWHRVLVLKKVVQIILIPIESPSSNHLNYNLNSLIFFKNSHWSFDLDWLFEISTDYEFIQNTIWGLRHYLYTDWSGKFMSVPRGSKAHWVDLLKKYFED